MKAIAQYTILLLAYRLPSLTPAAFQSYYETTHVPLLQSIAGPLFPNSHTRHYIHRSESAPACVNNSSSLCTYPATVLVGHQPDFEYDAIAELKFDNETAFHAFVGRVSEPEAARRIAQDEGNFLDRPKLKVVVMGDIRVTGRLVDDVVVDVVVDDVVVDDDVGVGVVVVDYGQP